MTNQSEINQCFRIIGGKSVSGEVFISGAKNSALPILAASLLTSEKIVLRNIPNLTDTHVMLEILKFLGKKIKYKVKEHTVIIEGDYSRISPPLSLMVKMRASICVLGPLIGYKHEARVAMPGGCVLGQRPIDLHVKAVEELGAEVQYEGDYIYLKVKDRLRGTRLNIGSSRGVTVLGTANAISTAVLAEGETIITQAAREPEVVDLGNFLNTLGAKISGLGTDVIHIQGVSSLKGGEYSIISDRIELGTFIALAAVTKGKLKLNYDGNHYLQTPLEKISSFMNIDFNKNSLEVSLKREIQPFDIYTEAYPSFPTDLQAIFSIMLILAQGKSTVVENIFTDRFRHFYELLKLGANIQFKNSKIHIQGVQKLYGANVIASDLRAGAGLVLALAAAEGEGTVSPFKHIDRGYECFDEKLRNVGVCINREE